MKDLNISRCLSLIERIRDNTEALHWLQVEAEKIDLKNRTHINASVKVLWAGACRGSREAEKVLTAFANVHIPDIFEDAKANCINSINLDREALLRELTE